MRARFLIASAFFFYLGVSVAFAWGDSGAGGCCTEVARELLKEQSEKVQNEGVRMFEKFVALDRKELAFLIAIDDICKHTECNGVEPKMTKKMAHLALAEANTRRSNWINTIIAIGTILTALVAIAAFIVSWAAERRSRRNERRSMENEIRINDIAKNA